MMMQLAQVQMLITQSIKLSYAYGPITVAYSDHEYDSNAADTDQDTNILQSVLHCI
jgi:hypothetical protein